MSHIFNITTDPIGAEAKIFSNVIRQTAVHRGKLLNVLDNKEYDVSLLPDSELTPDKFPFMGRNKHSGKVNTVDGYTTKLGLKETAAGKWCYIQPHDYTYQMQTGINEDGAPIYTDVLIEHSKIVEGFPWDSSSETEPEWKIAAEEE